jgi:DNA-directed RNA polymerase subunit omega
MPVQPRNTLMNPPIENLLDKVDSKFTLVALSSKRARQINSYYNQLGEGLGVVVPPQVASVSGKPLTIAFEEVAAGKATFHRIEPGEEGDTEVVAEIVGGEGATAPGETAVDFLAVGDPGSGADAPDPLLAADLTAADTALVDLAASEIIDAPGDETEPPADQ